MEDYIIYFALNPQENAIKIGRTKNLDSRLSTLQTGNIHKLRLIAKLPNVSASFESHIHDMCKAYHKRGEWFSIEALDHLLKHPFYSSEIELLKSK
ncbi:MAG: GIY-YIG nuclease family protein [Candidatus Woesearchaeota archaeon]|jgi:hypothetical protein|nr:GIY-YIG nuclease family protein [Candidatus Woesearchaeota archaeon]